MSCYLLPSIYHLAIYLSFHLIFSLLVFLPSPCLFLARLFVFSVLLIVCRALIGAIAIAMLFPCHRHPHCYCSPMPAATNLLSPPSLRQCCPLPRPCLLPPASYDLPAASRLLSSTFSLPFDFCYLLYSCLAELSSCHRRRLSCHAMPCHRHCRCHSIDIVVLHLPSAFDTSADHRPRHRSVPSCLHLACFVLRASSCVLRLACSVSLLYLLNFRFVFRYPFC